MVFWIPLILMASAFCLFTPFTPRPFRPHLDPDDAGGAGEGGEAGEGTADADAGTAEGAGEGSTIDPTDTGVDHNAARAALREREADARIAELESKLEETTAEIRAGRQTVNNDAETYKNDPAMALLIQMRDDLKSEVKQIRSEISSIKTDVDNSKYDNARTRENTIAQGEVEKVIAKHHILSKNPAAAKLLKKNAETWANRQFNPKGDIPAQRQQFKIAVHEYILENQESWAPGANSAGTTQTPGKETDDKRAAALERDAHRKGSIAATGTAPPTRTSDKVLQDAGDFYGAYERAAKAAGLM